jgi:hypothetical protein
MWGWLSAATACASRSNLSRACGFRDNIGRPGVAVARDKIVLALEERRGNIWMLEPRVSAPR